MAQCPGCNKFASLETQEPEVESLDVDENGRITGEVRVVRTSACCGEEMKEMRFELDLDPADEVAEHVHDHEEAGEEFSLTVEDSGVSADEELETTTRDGKPIKSYRYMKTRIGYTIDVQVNCDCGWSHNVQHSDFAYASAFEELV